MLECLVVYNIKRTLTAFTQWSYGKQQCNAKSIAQINFKHRICQGDGLSPLLFCIGLNPFSKIIMKSSYGYVK